MSANVFFDWPTAAQAGKAGFFVRRNLWTDRWLQYYNGLWWLRLGSETPRVVQASDFGRDEFLAGDWTNLPPACVQAAQEASGQTCPKPFEPNDPGSQEVGGDEGGGGSGNPPDGGDDNAGEGTGGNSDGGSSGGNPTTGDPGFPPGGGGGGWGGSGSGRGRPPRRPRASIQWPSLTMSMDDWTEPHPCYPTDGTNTRNAAFGGSIALGITPDTAAGKPAAGAYFVSIRNGNRVLWSHLMWPGDNLDYGIHTVGPGFPGQSAFTFQGRAHLALSNSGDIVATATRTMQPWCAYEFQFWCEAPGGCHEGVGWVTIRAPSGAILYEGCPPQGVLGLGNTSISAGTDITLQYSTWNGPCPGSHCCDAAVFRVHLARGGAHVVLGIADLNNLGDCGDRGPFTFTITQEMLDALEAP